MWRHRILLLGLALLPSGGQAQQSRPVVVPGDAPVVIAPRGAAQPRLPAGTQFADPSSFATRPAPGARPAGAGVAGGSLGSAGAMALPALGAAVLGAVLGGGDSVSSTTRTR